AANGIIAECAGLPLALSVVGAMLRRADEGAWTEMTDLLRRADLSAIENLLPPGQESFFKAIEISFHSLRPEMQERFRQLAVLPEDMAAPLEILQAVWGATRAEARQFSQQIADRSLGQREETGDGLRLHDLQLDYARANFADGTALRLIQGA